MTLNNEFDIRSINDADLAALVASGQAELAAREKRRREETIAKIRALAGEAGLSVSIAGARGRPGGAKTTTRAARSDDAK